MIAFRAGRRDVGEAPLVDDRARRQFPEIAREVGGQPRRPGPHHARVDLEVVVRIRRRRCARGTCSSWAVDNPNDRSKGVRSGCRLRMAVSTRSRLVMRAAHQAPRQHHGGRRVVGVPVGADLVGEALRHGGAAHDHLHGVPHARLLQRLHGRPHLQHRGGEQGRQPDDVRAVVGDRGHEPLGRHVRAEVDHLEPAALEQRHDEVLPDVVHVALHRADGDAPGRGGLGAGQQRGDDRLRRLERARGDEQLGHEELPALEEAPGFVHRRDERLVDQRRGAPGPRRAPAAWRRRRRRPARR